MRISQLLLIYSVQVVVFAAFSAPCAADVDCNTGGRESCVRVTAGPTASYRCFRFPLTDAEFQTAFEDRGATVGNLRKCDTPTSKGCKGSRLEVGNPLECCAHQVTIGHTRSLKPIFVCDNATDCDVSGGCKVTADCPISDYCIANKCGQPTPGVDCGSEGKPSLKYGCCGSGVVGHDGMCFSAQFGGGNCSQDSECLGRYNGKATRCCNGRCILLHDKC